MIKSERKRPDYHLQLANLLLDAVNLGTTIGKSDSPPGSMHPAWGPEATEINKRLAVIMRKLGICNEQIVPK